MDVFQKQINYTVNLTYNKFDELNKAYHDKMHISVQTSTFDPAKQKIPIQIDGLYKKDGYINKAFMKLNMQTNITLTITPEVQVHITIYHMKHERLVYKCVKRIYSMLKVFGNKTYFKYYNNTNFYILLFDAPRIITQKYQDSTEEINLFGKNQYFNCTNGYATVSPPFTICVTRKNGCLGLLVHELGHICELDLGVFTSKGFEPSFGRLSAWRYVQKITFDIAPTYKMGNMIEGINNGHASIIHAMFNAIEHTYDEMDLMKNYRYYYAKEFVHAINQSIDLLHWFGYQSFRDILWKSKRKFTQDSMLMEYILVRCVYLLHFNKLEVFTRNIKPSGDNDYIGEFMKYFIKTDPLIDEMMKKRSNHHSVTNMEYFCK